MSWAAAGGLIPTSPALGRYGHSAMRRCGCGGRCSACHRGLQAVRNAEGAPGSGDLEQAVDGRLEGAGENEYRSRRSVGLPGLRAGCGGWMSPRSMFRTGLRPCGRNHLPLPRRGTGRRQVHCRGRLAGERRDAFVPGGGDHEFALASSNPGILLYRGWTSGPRGSRWWKEDFRPSKSARVETRVKRLV